MVGYVDRWRHCGALCASRGGDADGGAEDLEAEAWEIGRCGDEMGNRMGLGGWRGTLDKPYGATNRAIRMLYCTVRQPASDIGGMIMRASELLIPPKPMQRQL